MKKQVTRILLRPARKKNKIRSEQYVILIFMTVILLGALLLTLPIASRSGESSGFLTALFTATSATCVTGLALVDTYVQWSGFGQVVILCLIQIGGLGFMTIISVFFFILHRKIGLKQRLIMAQGFSLNDIDGVVSLVRKVLEGTLLVESIGAIILTMRFMDDFGFWRALRWGIFHSVSAFCNAGFDIFGYLEPGSSLMLFATDPIVTGTIMALIILGGLGFYVWVNIGSNRQIKNWSVHTKLVMTITGLLIVGGTALFALFEWNNPATIGNMSTGDKMLTSLFQSVTCRTAGFATVDQSMLTDSSQAVSVILMLIGGSSGSTAGGIKTVTFGIVALSVFGMATNKSRVTVFKRTIAQEQIHQAITIMVLLITLAFTGAIFISASNGIGFMPSLFETASALGTVGLTANVTPGLNIISQILIIVFMFFGRVGIMTMGSNVEERYHYAETKVLIG